MRLASCITAAMALALMATYSPTALADVETATLAVKACVTKHLPGERLKHKPTRKNILGICSKQVRNLLDILPEGMETDVLDLIETDIDKELSDSKT